MSSKTNKEHTYKVLFHNQGQIFEVYAKNIYQSDLYGFVEVEDYVFGNHSQMLIDPAEDKLRSEFEGVQRSVRRDSKIGTRRYSKVCIRRQSRVDIRRHSKVPCKALKGQHTKALHSIALYGIAQHCIALQRIGTYAP